MPLQLKGRSRPHVTWIPEVPNPATDFPKQHKFDKQLQQGSEGTVEAWIHQPSGTVIAVKVVMCRLHDPGEVQLLRELPRHTNIIRYLGFAAHQPFAEKSSILLEYCPCGDLFDVRALIAKREEDRFLEGFMWSVFDQLASALAFLHEGIDKTHPLGRDHWKTIVHRDIKMENVFVSTLGSKHDLSGIALKLGDFGMAAYYNPLDPNPLRLIGTTHTWPPEVIWETRKLSPASDVWGAGAILHELAHNFGPLFSVESTKEKWFATELRAPYPSGWPEVCKNNYWGAKARRRVVPINLEPDDELPALPMSGDTDVYTDMIREEKPSLKYSHALNECMMVALNMNADARVGSGELLSIIEEAHAEFLFRSLRIEHEKESGAIEGPDMGYLCESSWWSKNRDDTSVSV